ncbi:hypothetical protein DC20_08110 [Rufibacter tibetensis]|uniref:Uncharacterized protein n=1 Tax=Rufibacter tibetensis TaxID=512763 RepID=A0A0P0C1Z9_9BACT|nr:hypothetical protein DC20_08110 [Rufibacter tibetensis]
MPQWLVLSKTKCKLESESNRAPLVSRSKTSCYKRKWVEAREDTRGAAVLYAFCLKKNSST